MPGSVVAGTIDIAAFGKDEQPVLVAEARTRPAQPEDLAELSSYLVMLAHAIPFAMFADPEKIQLFRWDGEKLSAPLAVLHTPDVLREYEPEFGRLRIFGRYLVSLIEGWLRDLAYHWKSPAPPGAEEVRKIGLLEKLDGGTTASELEIIGGHLRSVR